MKVSGPFPIESWLFVVWLWVKNTRYLNDPTGKGKIDHPLATWVPTVDRALLFDPKPDLFC